jgi:PHD/YefM family antitoxin component YafN of YafNO toxin-antitoxin module
MTDTVETAIEQARDVLLQVDEFESVLEIASRVTLAVLPVFLAEFEQTRLEDLALINQARHETVAARAQRDEIFDQVRVHNRALRMFSEEVAEGVRSDTIAAQITAGLAQGGHNLDRRDMVFIQTAVAQTVKHVMRALGFALSSDALAVLDNDL